MEGYSIKTTFVAINTQYIHTNPAVRGIAAYCSRSGIEVDLIESTINNSPRSILEDICSHKADIYMFSCYLWNVDIIERITSDLRKAFPNTFIGIGGPQVSFHQREFLKKNSQVDFIIYGEGEEGVCELLRCLEKGEGLRETKGLCFRDGNEIVVTKAREPFILDKLPFIYSDLSEVKDRILYYESMRGCPFACSYCLSGRDEKIRVRALDLVYRDLDVFLKAGVKQVKFVDRTFNALKEHALSIWQYLIRNDNGITNFHFEISGELFDAEMMSTLKEARPGLFQFEIGIQSVNQETLKAIRRSSDFHTLSSNVEYLKKLGNIHLHLDLIAGLPCEDYISFKGSFNSVYNLKPHQLQLGFLKVLPGSEMEKMAEEHEIVYSKHAPFEVIRTKWLTYEEVCLLFGVADMVETYYNSGNFLLTLNYLMQHFESAFSFFEALWIFYKKNGYDKAQLSSFMRYETIWNFMEDNNIPLTDKLKWFIKLDMLKKEKFVKFPSFVDVDMSEIYKQEIREMVKSNLTANKSRKSIHVEVVPFQPVTGALEHTAVLFDYLNKITSYVKMQNVQRDMVQRFNKRQEQ